ncbi:MAG: hypothetical protein NT007_14425 [Candidatus Kapabacteria bacterium]|nr:hypothetical protein [Candidatus Kapabacteria bacterium]
MSNEILILIGGIHSLSFVIFHILFWKIFDWKRDLERISKVNKAILQILNLRLIFVFFFTALLCIFYSHDLLTTSIGRVFLLGGFLFWFGRAIEQVIFFGIKSLKSNLMTIIFLIGAALFLIPLLG